MVLYFYVFLHKNEQYLFTLSISSLILYFNFKHLSISRAFFPVCGYIAVNVK